jgi:hypothetical protein|nr:MAG TPA: tail assembly chaperone protein [Caudoviricetes sp.]
MILNINGKDYELKYSMKILKKLSLSGLDPFRDTEKVTGTVANTIKSFHYGLLEENNKMTEAMAEKLMDAYVAEGNSILDLSSLVLEAIMEGLGMNTDAEMEDNEENEEGK